MFGADEILNAWLRMSYLQGVIAAAGFGPLDYSEFGIYTSEQPINSNGLTQPIIRIRCHTCQRYIAELQSGISAPAILAIMESHEHAVQCSV